MMPSITHKHIPPSKPNPTPSDAKTNGPHPPTFGLLAKVDVHGGEVVGLGNVLQELADHPPDLVLHRAAQPRLDQDARPRGGREGHGHQYLGVVLEAGAEGSLGPGCVCLGVVGRLSVEGIAFVVWLGFGCSVLREARHILCVRDGIQLSR
jgi:hypothetical protein